MVVTSRELSTDRRLRGVADTGRGGWVALLTGMVVAAGMVTATPASGDLEDEKRTADAAAADAHGEVVEVNKKVDKATKLLVKVRDELPAAKAKLSSAIAAQARANADNRAAIQDLELAQSDIRAAKAKLGRIEKQIDDLRGDVGEFARRAYQIGPLAKLEVLLDARDPSDFTHRLESIRVVSQSSNAVLTTMSKSRADLDHAQIRLGSLRDIAVGKTDAAEGRLAAAQEAAKRAGSAKKRVDDLVASKQSAVATVKAQRTEVKASYDDLAAEQSRVEDEIAAAVREAERRAIEEAERQAAAERKAERQAAARRAAAEREAEKQAKSDASSKSSRSSGSSSSSRSSSSSSSTRSTPTKKSKPRSTPSSRSRSSSSGQWTFPISGGRIGSEAGWRFHPILRYTKCHTGADISARSGTRIRAAASGTVIMARWGGGFGNYTTISHGNGLTSSYAHQSSFAVRSGQWVNKGQTIGYVGSTGYSTGPHLHFEARIYGVPYNPRGWLGSGSKVKACR